MLRRLGVFLFRRWRRWPLQTKWLAATGGLMLVVTGLSLVVFMRVAGPAKDGSWNYQAGLSVLGLSLLVATGLMLAVGWALARETGQTLTKLVNVTRTLEKSNLKLASGLGALVAEIEPTSQNEVEQFLLAFRTMIVELRSLGEETARLADARARHLTAAAEIAQATTSSLDLDIVLRKSIELIRDRFGFYHVSVFIVDPQSGDAVLRQATGGAGYALMAHEYQLMVGSESLVEAAIKTRQPRLVQDVTAAPGYLPSPLLPDTRAEAVVPMLSGDTVAGALELKSTQPNAFGVEIVAVLQGLAAQVAVSVQNARLYASELSRRQVAETLQAVGRLLGSTLDLKEVLQRLLEQLAKAVPLDRAAVMLLAESRLQVAAVRGFDAAALPALEGETIAADEIFARLADGRKPVVQTGSVQWLGWQQLGWTPAQASWVGAPLIVQAEVMGMIAVGRERFEAYTAEEAEVIFTFANQAAIAIQNARLYDQVTRFNQQLEQRVKDRTVELERAYDRLTKMDHNKTDFISIAAHEMRTPLTVLLGYTSLLKADAGIQADPQLVEVLDGILNGASRMHEVINQMLEAARVDSQQLDMHLRQMNLSLVIQRVRGDFRMAVAERSLTLEIKDLNQLPTIQADVELLYKVFYNVVINAIKYTPDGGRIAISHNLRREGTATWVDVMVQDTGVGIAPEYHELIFEKFYQMGEVAFHSSGKTKFKGGGAGLGLAIARGIVQAHHGRIWVESPGHDEKLCPGSCFHILLPVAVSRALPLAEPE